MIGVVAYPARRTPLLDGIGGERDRRPAPASPGLLEASDSAAGPGLRWAHAKGRPVGATGEFPGRRLWSYGDEAGAERVASRFGDAALSQAVPVLNAVASVEELAQFVQRQVSDWPASCELAVGRGIRADAARPA